MTRYLLGVTFDRRRHHPDGGVAAGRDRGAHGLLPHAQPRADQNGELTGGEILTGPDLAKIVTSDGATAPVVTDGPFAEFKEWLAGYQIFDVESEERALEIAARLSAVPGPGGVPLQQPIHVRRIMDEGPSTADEMREYAGTAGGER